MLSYLTGPFAVLVTDASRRSGLWTAIGITSGLAWFAMPSGWERFLLRIDHAGFVVLSWLLVTGFSTLAGYSAWARGILQATGELDSIPPRLPRWMQGPLPVATIGMLVPGLGLLFAGHRRAAAAAFWLPAPLVLATLVMWNSGWLWTWNSASERHGLPSAFLEWVFLGVIALGCVSAVGWVVQALDGARRAGDAGEEHRSARVGRGDWAALALVISAAVFLVVFEPSDAARDLNGLAISLEQDGYGVLPLHLTRAAIRLDPSRPAYTLHALELYQALGQDSRAQESRAELDRRMGPYVSALRQEGWRQTALDSAPHAP